MRRVFLLLIVFALASCGQSESEMDCARTVECTLYNCSGEVFSTIQVSACDAEGMLNGCCPALEEVTCHCAGL